MGFFKKVFGNKKGTGKPQPRAQDNSNDDDNRRKFFTAAENGTLTEMEALVSAGVNVNARGNFKTTPLYRVMCSSGMTTKSMVPAKTTWLIGQGADVNAANADGDSILYEAVVCGQRDVIDSLIAAGAQIDHQNKHGRTPLMAAALKGHTVIAQKLIQHGASLDLKDNYGKTALDTAKAEPDFRTGDVQKVLIVAGAK